MDKRDHGKAFGALPDRLRDAPDGEPGVEDRGGYGMLASGEAARWKPPDGDVVLEQVPDFTLGLDYSDRLHYRVRTNVRWSVVSHSPDGFEWGYSGSGCADLSLNILNMFVPPAYDKREPVPCYEGEASRTAWDLHQDFKQAVIARVPWDGATLSGKEIRRWIDERTREVKEGT